jgi:membrane-associated phospholipid phosphatase
MAGAVAAGLFFVSRKLGVLAAAVALLMAFARVYIAVHDPADVLAGLIIGTAISGTFCALLEDAATRRVAAVSRTWLRPLVAPPVVPAAGRAGAAVP